MSKKLNTKAFDAPLKVDLPKPPVRTPVPEPEAERFVEEEVAPRADETTVKRKTTPPPLSAARAPRTAVVKAPAKVSSTASRLRRDESGERVVAYVPPDLATDLRVTCARSRRSMSDAVTEALTMWLSAQNTK